MALTTTLPLARVVADAYGEGMKINVTLADLQGLGAFTTGTLVVPVQLPAGAIVQLIRIIPTQLVAGSGPVTAATAGLVTTNNTYTTADVFTALTATTLQPTSSNVENVSTATTVNIAIALTGGNAGDLTAGAFSVLYRYVLLA